MDETRKKFGVLLNRRFITAFIFLILIVWASFTFFVKPLHARAGIIAGLCLILWLSEIVPAFVPTLLLWTLVPLALSPLGEGFRLSKVLAWAADPVLALFLGGFVLSVAASRYGLDRRLARLALGWSRGSPLRLLVLTATATAVLSMWMSNIAAAAIMLAGVHQLLAKVEKENSIRRALLVGIALGADFGGIATPVGTGPNAIAIGWISRTHNVTFLGWMSFALPLSLGLLAAGIFLIALRFKVSRKDSFAWLSLPVEEGETNSQQRGAKGVIVIFALTVIAWLSEPLHGVPASVIALASSVALFGSGLLSRNDLARVDWATLLLIAGGITLGNLLETTGLVRELASHISWGEAHPFVRIFLLCFTSAILSALMSNTAAATMLIPFAASLDPAPSTSILIAIAASLGMPFVISTPPNAMAYGEGMKTSDLLLPGLLLMIGGCLLISLTGRFVLNLAGIP